MSLAQWISAAVIFVAALFSFGSYAYFIVSDRKARR